MRGFFRCVAEAVVEKGVVGLVVDLVPGGTWLLEIADSSWQKWRAQQRNDDLRAEVQELAAATQEAAREAAREVAREVAGGDPKSTLDLELYLSQIPAVVRRSLVRQDDLLGVTVPAGFEVRDADDMAKLLPPRLPRFRPGDAPGFLRGWVLEEQVGVGGFGEVWRGRNRRATSLVAAFKFGHALTDRDLSLVHEHNVINRVMEAGRHPGIVALEDVWDEGDEVPWLRYEFVAGGDLTGLIHAWQALAPAVRLVMAVTALRELAETVGHFHRLNPAIVHRDLKPSNILVDRATGRLKVADFGIGAVSARRLLDVEGSRSLSRGGREQAMHWGAYTPLYASPQQRAGAREMDPRDDVHALGVIAYQMVTGRLDLGAGPDFADELRDCGVAEDLVALLSRCVAQRAERRPEDAFELATALAAMSRIEPDLFDAAAGRPPYPERMPNSMVPPTAVTTAVAKRPNVTLPPIPPGLEPTYDGIVDGIVELFSVKGGWGFGRVAFSPDGRLLAATHCDKRVALWDTATGDVILTLAGSTGTCEGVAFGPDGRVVVASDSDHCSKLWDAVTGQHLHTLKGDNPAFSPDGRVVATIDMATTTLWDAASGHEVSTLVGHSVAFSPDGQVVATAVGATVRMWDVTSARVIRTLNGHKETVTRVAFSPDGRVLATASDDKTIILWDAATGRGRERLVGHTGHILDMAFHPGGLFLMTGGMRGQPWIWEVSTGEGCVLDRTDFGYVQTGVAFSPNGRLLAVASHMVMWRSDLTVSFLCRPGESADWTTEYERGPSKPIITIVRSGNGMVYPGEHIWALVSIENRGPVDLSLVRAEVRSQNFTLRGWSTIFGRVKPGEKVERCLAALLPADTPPGELRGELIFHALNDGFPTHPRLLAFTVRPFPRPDFLTTWKVINDGSELSHGSGDGRPKRGECIDLAVIVHNQTGESYDEMFVSLAAKTVPSGTCVTAPRGDLGTVSDGATSTTRVGFAVAPEGQSGPATFVLMVESLDGRTLALEKIELVIG